MSITAREALEALQMLARGLFDEGRDPGDEVETVKQFIMEHAGEEANGD